MLSFIDSYMLWRALPFPVGGAGAELIDTHGDLAEADEYVTTVIRFVERGVFVEAPVDVLSLLKEIMSRLDGITERVSGDSQRVARSQHAYAALLHLVYRQFLEMNPGDSPARG
ncbi:hypothetical protein [Micromonospora sp. NPDC050495]|uniref:hypothetical protein n=1 Tax=Micromonospora sp. NPDC050495 TaxID=3154936 RepID=UPI0033C0AF64